MPRHIIRLILLMAAFGAAAYAAMTFFTADSFYKYGHYRGDSVAEIASDKPKYTGTASCRQPHPSYTCRYRGSCSRSSSSSAVGFSRDSLGVSRQRFLD